MYLAYEKIWGYVLTCKKQRAKLVQFQHTVEQKTSLI